MHLYGGVGKAQRSTSRISFQVHVCLLFLRQCLPLESGAHWPSSTCWITNLESPYPLLASTGIGSTHYHTWHKFWRALYSWALSPDCLLVVWCSISLPPHSYQICISKINKTTPSWFSYIGDMLHWKFQLWMLMYTTMTQTHEIISLPILSKLFSATRLNSLPKPLSTICTCEPPSVPSSCKETDPFFLLPELLPTYFLFRRLSRPFPK